MRSSAQIKAEMIEQFGRTPADTGSPEVQIAILTKMIKCLTEHLKTHKKDFHSRRGLISMVNRRRKLLSYLKAHKMSVYAKLIQDLELRG